MRIIIFFLTIGCLFGYSQNSIPKNYFTHPLDIPLAASGTFGELRSNHFHSGLDLKTEGKEGLPVYAAADGEIVRIKVSHFGYGKALYIKHPNGYSTVYAHLKNFSPKIEAYVKKRQYAKESYEIQLYPEKGTLTVKKGEVIAASGNTGGSGGPHLHYEIRDSKARPMNPLDFGVKVADTKAPIIHGVWLYSLGEDSHINGTQEKLKIRLTDKGSNHFIAEKIHAFGKIGIGVATIDKQNLSNNKNGVYGITSSVNGKKVFDLKMNRFSFGETRYINRLIDYGHYKKNKKRIAKLFIEKNNPLSVYKKKDENGTIIIKDSLAYQIQIQIRDHQNNTTTIDIPIEGKIVPNIAKTKTQITPYLAKHTENFTHTEGNFDMYIPKGSLYEDAYLNISRGIDTVHVHNNETPLHKNMTIAFDVSNYNPEDQKKLYIGGLTYKGKHYYSKTTKKGNRLLTKTRSFGTYKVFIDSIAPKIVPINVTDKKWMTEESHLKIKINDEETGVDSFRATINGKFILMEYDYKTGMLVYDFEDKIISISQNKLELTVLDKVGNRSSYKCTFFRKP